ncbi:hypothetical protein DMUE_5019 [Dictyocoela muelleri]|nr:hypothetical protein DMUE_5019 [Dictyocoela muelleri]
MFGSGLPNTGVKNFSKFFKIKKRCWGALLENLIFNTAQTDVDSILLNKEDALCYIQQKGLSKSTIPCINLRQNCDINMKIYRSKNYLPKNCYTCTKCGVEKTSFSGLHISSPKIPFSKYFRAVYKFCENLMRRMF